MSTCDGVDEDEVVRVWGTVLIKGKGSLVRERTANCR